jgi:hypothetical protein
MEWDKVNKRYFTIVALEVFAMVMGQTVSRSASAPPSPV